MLAEREQLLAQRDAEVHSLQQHLAELLGMPAAQAPALHRARYGQPGDEAATARIAALEVRCGDHWGQSPGARLHAVCLPV